MKNIRKLWRWVLGLFNSKSKPISDDEFIVAVIKDIYTYRFIKDFQDELLEGEIYIVGENKFYWLITFKCPCGCSEIVQLNLLEEASPSWKFEISDSNLLSIKPSIWRTKGCKSHLFVTDGRILWVNESN